MEEFSIYFDEMYSDFEDNGNDNDLYPNTSSSSNDFFDANLNPDDILNDQTFYNVNTNNCTNSDITTNKNVSCIYSADTSVPYNPFLLKKRSIFI